MAEFETPDDLLAAAKATFAAGYRKIDGYSPLPVHGLGDAIGFPRTKLPWLVFCFGILGGICGYGLCYWVSVIDYPMNIAGKPLHSGPMFIPVTFELTILFAALSAAFGMFIANGLPQPYHPVFNVESFARASQDRFFLSIEADDPQFDLDKTRNFLNGLNPHEVAEVEN
ncbi:MAG: DUF3341 domain-containing protein [Gemmatimonadetes bacterium]|nr:DUF3341 domain-containing protein [Gemmatimonadota bacterium]MBT5804360.1 DUF3341 domain-containing protein [Gemmatimonadota bacterium]MBT6623418.1 DUF3341 domain-containing protein [Gemmatimonadota bacterium]MBT7548980.1 DUF3341 domain-containing protein [Gemmatimonadota bacterium]